MFILILKIIAGAVLLLATLIAIIYGVIVWFGREFDWVDEDYQDPDK